MSSNKYTLPFMSILKNEIVKRKFLGTLGELQNLFWPRENSELRFPLM